MNRRLVLGMRSTAAMATAALGLIGTQSGATAAPAKATPSAAPSPGVLIGMSSPVSQWATRLEQTGGVDARRLFADLASHDGKVKIAKSEIAAGRMPIMSFKLPKDDWAGAAKGQVRRFAAFPVCQTGCFARQGLRHNPP